MSTDIVCMALKKSNGDANSYVKMGRNFMDFFPLFFFKWEFPFFIGKGVK